MKKKWYLRKFYRSKKKHSMKPFIEILATSTMMDELVKQDKKAFRKFVRVF